MRQTESERHEHLVIAQRVAFVIGALIGFCVGLIGSALCNGG